MKLTSYIELPSKRNRKPLLPTDFISLSALFVPAFLFCTGLIYLGYFDSRFQWLRTPVNYPWEFWLIAFAGTVATLGGVGDWIIHRLFVATGPKERRAHLLALATGGVPLALLMGWASVAERPQALLIPITLAVLYTTTLICYDEFQFHLKRCTPIETLMHRLLVFGNGAAWLAWLHWIFVRTLP